MGFVLLCVPQDNNRLTHFTFDVPQSTHGRGMNWSPLKGDIVGNKDGSDDIRGTDSDPAIFTLYPILSPMVSCLRCG
jgi:hypothetical protein